MNKAEIKQIILEEIENAMNDMASNLNNRELVDSLATILSVPDIEDDEIEGPGIEDLSPDSIFGSDPSYVEEMARPKETWVATPKLEALLQHFVGKGGVDGLTAAMERISNVLTKTQNVGFKSRAKKYQKRFFTDEAGNVDKVKLRQFAKLLLNPAGFTQSDIQNFVGFKNSAQANAFKMKLYKAKLINVQQSQDDSEDVSESKKKLEFDFSQVETPEKLPIDVDEQDLMDNIKKELKSSAEDYSGDNDKKTANQLKDAVNWVDKNSLKGKVTLEEVYNFLTEFHKQLPDDDKMFLHEPTILELIEDEFKPYVDTEEEYQKIVSSVKQYLSSKQPQTMSELEKYIKQQIREAKNPLAKKMKEIENQGRVAALETKLAAIAEMIEETEGRLTRIDEDNEFADMMDKNAVKEVRKQLKELEKAKGKLEKERAKMEGKVEKKKEPVVDEDAPIGEDIFDTAIDEIDLEEETFELNESTLRFQKLAGLITESDIQKKN